MDGYIIAVNETISPFDDPVADVRVEDTPLDHHCEAALRAAGCQTIKRLCSPGERSDNNGCALMISGDLWITRQLAEAFAKQALALNRPCILTLPEGLLSEFTLALQDLGSAEIEGSVAHIYPLAFIPAGHELSSDEFSGDLARDHKVFGFEPLLIDPMTDPMTIPVHRVFAPEEALHVPFSHLSAVRISHWLHLLRANQLARLAWGANLTRFQQLRLLWAAIRAVSVNKWKVMARLSTFGKNCDIHPTATVEASVLGDNVSVGAGAIVRFSYLADNVKIGDSSHVLSSVLGEGASTSRMGMLQSCVLYPKANSGHYGLQLCVIGQGSFIGGEVVLGDFKPDGDIMVMHRGELISTDTNLLGCAVGHDCSIMMRATTYAGREVPNGYTIIGPPHDIITKIPDNLPRGGVPLFAQGGVLTPYKKSSKRDNSTGEGP